MSALRDIITSPYLRPEQPSLEVALTTVLLIYSFIIQVYFPADRAFFCPRSVHAQQKMFLSGESPM